MAWVKIPAENHPLFHAALPKDPRISTLNMFGGVAAMVNGNMFGGLFARSVIVKLDDADRHAAMAIDGTEPFDPMGNGRVMSNTLLLGEGVMDEPEELRDWLRKAFDYAKALPPKQKKGAAKPAAKTATAKASTAKASTAKPAAKKTPAKMAPAKAAPAKAAPATTATANKVSAKQPIKATSRKR